MLAREESEQDTLSSLSKALSSMRSHREVLRTTMEEARRLCGSYSAEYRSVQQKLLDISAKLARIQSNGDMAAPDFAIEETALRDQESTLRQRQEWLSERLLETQGAYRKLRSVVQQQEDIIAYMASDMGSDQDNDDNSAQLSRIKLLQAQEDERRRLAREIHDGPAQVLANAIFELEYCDRLWEKNPEQMRQELGRLKQDLRDSLTDVRYFISDLRPVPLSELGLAPVLRRYVDDYQSRFSIKINANLEDLGRFPSHQELAIFRIIQEALQNTRKHSGASEVQIDITRDNDSITIALTDNGSGFDVESVATKQGQHFGLSSMAERASLMGGDLQIASERGRGTTVALTVPRLGEAAEV